MIVVKRADELQRGDVFSTDGYRVVSAAQLSDGRVSVELWLDASGGISKRDVLAADYPCPIYVDDVPGGITPEGVALGHRYVQGHINAYCPKCSEEHGVTVLDCDYDLDK